VRQVSHLTELNEVARSEKHKIKRHSGLTKIIRVPFYTYRGTSLPQRTDERRHTIESDGCRHQAVQIRAGI
jgi:hypothetical protein